MANSQLQGWDSAERMDWAHEWATGGEQVSAEPSESGSYLYKHVRSMVSSISRHVLSRLMRLRSDARVSYNGSGAGTTRGTLAADSASSASGLEETGSFDSELGWLQLQDLDDEVANALRGPPQAGAQGRMRLVLAAALAGPLAGGLAWQHQQRRPQLLTRSSSLVVSGATPDGSFAHSPNGATCSNSSPEFSASIIKTHHTTTTSDLWTLHIMRAHDPGVPEARRHKHPVLLCPGLASCGLGTFDLLPKVSLVDYLASQGWDVWCVSLRGNGRSSKPAFLDATTYWTIDDHLCQDVPAVLEFVLHATRAQQLHWVGHSMGGMLACGLLSQQGKYAATLRSLSLVGSGCFGDGSWHAVLKPIIRPIIKLGFPAGTAGQGLALLADTPAALTLFETLFYWAPNMEPDVRKAVLQQCFNFIPEPLVSQFLSSHDAPRGLTNVRGTFLYADPAALAALPDMPLLTMNGDWDLFCPPAGAAKTAALFPGSDVRSLVFGPGYGHRSHYGHFDIIQGRHAREETWSHLIKFLADNDALRTQPAGATPAAASAAAQQSAEAAHAQLEAAVQPPSAQDVHATGGANVGAARHLSAIVEGSEEAAGTPGSATPCLTRSASFQPALEPAARTPAAAPDADAAQP